MGFRFWKRVKIAPGVSLNLSKSSPSLSIGPRGAKITVSARGTQTTVGIPGTGLSYTERVSSKSQSSASLKPKRAGVNPEERLSLGFFKRLVIPECEQAFVDGCREFVAGAEDAALEHLRKAADMADGAFLAGFIALKKEFLDEAAGYLISATKKEKELGGSFSKYGMTAEVKLPITEEVSAQISPSVQGALLALVEVYQKQGRWLEAIDTLKHLRELAPEDVVIKLSLAELLYDTRPKDKNTLQEIVQLAEGVQNDSNIHVALILYKSRALKGLELCDAALNILTNLLRLRRDRPQELQLAILYERAMVYEAMGNERRARAEFEKIYSICSTYEDVASRLGL